MASRNVTIDPAVPAMAVDDPAVKSVLSLRTGKEIESRKLIEGRRYDRLVSGLRDVIADAIREGRPRLVCPDCSVAVRLISNKQKRFFFRHVVEDGSCPAVTKSDRDPDDVRAAKYNGARESDAHKALKECIASSVLSDAGFTELQVERTWRSRDRTSRRRPDVQASYRGLRVAFEAQLTTTFLDVVRGRRAFYLAEGGLLIWVLRRFDPNHRRMTEDDVLFSNNSNVIVVDKETVRLSQEQRRMFVRCHFREPYAIEGNRHERWQVAIVGFNELTLDVEKQRAYLFDFDAADREVAQQLVEWHRTDRLRDSILAFYSERNLRRELNDEDIALWGDIVDRANLRGIALPTTPREESRLHTAIVLLESARQGRPVGYGFEKLVQLAHQVAQSHPWMLVPFGFALKAYGSEKVVQDQDISGLWARRRKKLPEIIQADRKTYYVDLPYADTLRYLFPEIAHRLPG